MPHPFATDRAVAALRDARRVLVTGRGDGTAETAARACDLAEAVGAAVDFGGLEAAQAAGPTIARIGAVTADPGELHDRADLVVFWFCDPAADGAASLPRDVVTSATATGRPRHAIAVGPRAVTCGAKICRHLPLPETAGIDLARLLHAAVLGRAVPAPPPALAAPRDALHAALDAAGCVAFVTHHRDPTGLAAWSVAGLVRSLAHRTPAFEVPLTAAGNATAVCTWRYGAPGGIARADRDGADFRPAEDDAVRLVTRGEVDCVVAIGRLAAPVEAALAARGDAVVVIRIDADASRARTQLDALVAAVHATVVTAAGGRSPEPLERRGVR